MGETQVSIGDAIGNVEVLDEIVLSDSQPCIEAQAIPLQYRVNFDTNFEDKNAFISGQSRYVEEACRHAELNELLHEGFKHAVNLYAWRCCSRAVPMPTSNDQPNRMDIYHQVVEVMQVEVQKLLQLMYFQTKAIGRFCEEVKRLSHPEKRREFISESYLLTLGKMLDMFAVLDELKNMKASIKNDYSTFRRASQLLKTFADTQTVQESHSLSMFLATQNKIRDNLKTELIAIDGYEELLTDIVNICVFLFESKMYLSPKEKHLLVKVMAFGLYLIDSAQEPHLARLDQKKRINIPKIDRIFKTLEVVPLFADMQITPFTLVRRAEHYEPARWPLSHVGESDTCQVNIHERLARARLDHLDYVTHLARINNEMAVCDTTHDTPRSDAENREIAELALRGVQLLCAWTSDVVEMISWKLLHPCDVRTTPDCPADAENYERATRYNYNNDEKSALIEMISMIKGLQQLLSRMDTHFVDAIRRHVYAELQDFVQIALREPLRKALKNKKDIIKQLLQSVRDTCADTLNVHGAELTNTGKPTKGSSDVDVRVLRRPVAPGSTQLYIVRTMLESMLSDRGGAKKTIRKDLDNNTLVAIENFMRMSYFWPALLRFTTILVESGDLSQLWYREFYLEMTNGTRIQFPIEMSIPWILTDHILTGRNPALTECLLYQLDLYNDSAHCALITFGKQYLYDEVEAEVNLCFDQFVYKLSEQVFAHYKQMASSILLDKRFRNECQTNGINITIPCAMRYKTLLRQRHVQLLGRSIDLNRLVTQRVNIAMQKSLDTAISRFEASDLTHIVELSALIEANRLCHQLLREHLPGLCDFNDLLLEANHNVSAPYGRITLHVFWEINYDFLTNYCYNASTQRFVKTRVKGFVQPVNRDKLQQSTLANLWGSKSINAAYSNIYSMYNQFIGQPHFKAITRLIGYEGIAVVLQEMLGVCGQLLHGQLLQYTKNLMKLMPKVCRLPRYDYGSPAVLSFYNAQLQDVINYGDMRTEMFQHLRELGNCILFSMLLEQAMSHEEVTDLMHAAPFQNVIPRPCVREKETLEQKVKLLEQKYARLHVVQMLDRFGTPKQAAIAREGDLLTKERLCCGLSLFQVFLARLRDYLDDPVWRGPPAANGVMPIDECFEFHRLWSAIQFVYCMPGGENDVRVEEAFGEGLHWAGCTLIALLDQYRRFEVLDFSYHLLRVNRVDGKTENVRGVGDVTRVCERIRRFQMLNAQIFDCLDKHLTPGENVDGTTPFENVRCFPPPVHSALVQHQ